MKSPRSSLLAGYRTLAVILFVAAIIRVLYLIVYQSIPAWDQLTVDNYYHYHWAQVVASGNVVGDTTYFRAPFYVFALAAVYAMFGASLWAARLMGLVVGLVSITMTWLLGKRVFNSRVATTAALVQTLFPVIVYFESELLLDSFFTMLLQATVYFLILWQQTNRNHHAFAAGLFLGLAVITRPTALALLPVILIYQLVVSHDFRFRLRTFGTLWLLSPLVLIVGAVFVRNVAVASDPVLISSQGGINLYIGNNEQADGVTARLPEPLGNNWRLAEVRYLAEAEAGHDLKPGGISSYWTAKALDWVGSNPVGFVSLYIRKCYFAFTDLLLSNNRNLDRFFTDIVLLRYNPLSFGWVLVFAVFGLAAGRDNHPRSRFLVVLILCYVGLISLFFYNTRFRLPLLPYFILLAAYGLHAVKPMVINRARKLLPAAIAAMGAGLLSFFPVVTPAKAVSPMDETSRGLYYFADGDTETALRFFRQARSVDSTYPEVNLNLGVGLLKQGRADSAQYYLEQELHFNPGRYKSYVNLASLYLAEDVPEQAIPMAEKAVSLRPYDVTANMVLLRSAARSTGISDDSLLQMSRAAAGRTGNDIYLLVDAGNALTARGALGAAERLYLSALSASPPPIETDDEAFERHFRNSAAAWNLQRAQAYSQLAYTYGRRGAYGDAVDACRRAITLDTTLADAYINLINGYVAMGDFARADSVYLLAIRKFPDNQHLRMIQP